MKFASVIFVINNKNEILLVSRKDNHDSFGLPGGKQEDCDMSLVDTAVRETFEETGLKLDKTKLKSVLTRIDNGMTCTTFFYKEILDSNIEFNYLENHVVKWGTVDDLINGTFKKYNKTLLNKLFNEGLYLANTCCVCGSRMYETDGGGIFKIFNCASNDAKYWNFDRGSEQQHKAFHHFQDSRIVIDKNNYSIELKLTENNL